MKQKNVFCGIRNLFILSAVLMFSSAAMAGKPNVEVKKGNWKEIAISQGTANLVLDFSNCQVGIIDDGEFDKGREVKSLSDYHKMRGEDFVRDWPEDQKKIAEYFTVQFNRKKKKGLQVATDDADAKYTIRIIIEKMDLGNPVGIGFSPKSGGAIIVGRVVVVDNTTNEEVSEIVINEVKGASTFSERDRIGIAFMYLGKEMAKLK